MAYHLKIREKLNLFSAAAQGGGKGGGGGSPPPAPDPKATAQAQATANKETAIAQANINMVNQNTPYGKLEYTQRGSAEDGTPQYTATQTLSPEEQQKLDLTNQAAIKYGQTANTQMDAVKNRLSTPLDYSSLGAAPTIDENTRRQVSDAMYARMQPQMDRDRAALETRLANQGIAIGSQAYSDAIDEMNRQRTDARLAIDAQAGNEMRADYGVRAGARDRDINEMIQQRQVPLNELAAMLSGTQVQGPQFVSAPQTQVNPTDIMGATYAGYNGQMQAYAADRAGAASNRQGMYGLLGAGMQAGAYMY